jgi:hypothetical protein
MEPVVVYFKELSAYLTGGTRKSHNNPPSVGLFCPRDVNCKNLTSSTSQIRSKESHPPQRNVRSNHILIYDYDEQSRRSSVQRQGNGAGHYGIDARFSVRTRIFLLSAEFWLSLWATQSPPQRKRRPCGLNPITQLHIVPRLWMHAAVTPPPPIRLHGVVPD